MEAHVSYNFPQIRFDGFTDAWEQRKFGDEFKLSQGLQVPVEGQFAEQLENTEQFIRIIDVTQEGEPPRYVYNPTGKGRVKTDDIFFVRYGAVGTIGYGYNGVIANNLFKAEPLFKACNMFLFQQFSGTDFNKMLKEMSASTSMPAVNFGALNNLTFSIPSYEEQNKIGEYLGQLDNLISLHRCKYEKLQNIKKSMLDKMFPQNGCLYPEVRFEGFTDAWEQRKFGDEFKLSQGLQVPVEGQFAEQLENTEQFIRIIDVTQEGEPPRYVYNPTGKGRVKTDDIFFVRYGAVGTIGYGYNGVIANNLFKAEPLFKACNMFLFQQFSGTDFNKMLKEMSASTSMPAVNFGALNNLTFSIPSYEEQNKIGEYLGQLDNLISLHRCKCNTLKRLKKAMLEKMFI
ncbi:restriction endonuclease subunit S [uncultured Ruminococcus sp.]|uniref:restriction endonuclease subunit S n=1 Tax=uncultured Ruminococcus sp. TaxID=165186 RepID=UPI0025E2E71B|nr:restriction endonuclease subunit S [uncultured Ruminococcus sp.]